MDSRAFKVLVLGELPEANNIFSRALFAKSFLTAPVHVKDHDEFEGVLNASDIYSLILMDVMPYGLEVLEQVRRFRPACPVIMIGDPSQADVMLEAKRCGLGGYLFRQGGEFDEVFTDLLAEEVFTQLMRYVEPPTMVSPSADEMYRYAQYHNVLEPFFVVAQKRYLLYVNDAGRALLESAYGTFVRVGDPIEMWVLEATLDAFRETLGRAFAGHSVVRERRFEQLAGQGLRELYYQPVIDPGGCTVAVSISVHQPERPELQRAWFMRKTSEMLSWVSHENNNLLSILMSNADLLSIRLSELGDEEALRRMEAIDVAIERAVHSTQQMQAFSRTGVIQPENIELNVLIEAMIVVVRGQIASDIELVFEPDNSFISLYADRQNWETVVVTVLQNGAEEMSGGCIRMQTDLVNVGPTDLGVPVGPGRYALLEVVFDGRVMLDWLQDHQFDPFFTHRDKPGYSGLELATVKNIIEQGGGRITLRDTGQQTVVRIYYPTA